MKEVKKDPFKPIGVNIQVKTVLTVQIEDTLQYKDSLLLRRLKTVASRSQPVKQAQDQVNTKKEGAMLRRLKKRPKKGLKINQEAAKRKQNRKLFKLEVKRRKISYIQGYIVDKARKLILDSYILINPLIRKDPTPNEKKRTSHTGLQLLSLNNQTHNYVSLISSLGLLITPTTPRRKQLSKTIASK